MSIHQRAAALFLLACGVAQAIPPFTRDFETADSTTAVFSGISADYARNRLPDGTYQAERYAFGNGGFYGSTSSDETIDNVTFTDVARTIARPLAEHNFLPTKDPKKANLLIMVYWGATSGTMDPHSENYHYTNTSTPLPGGYHLTRVILPEKMDRSITLLGPVSFQGGLVDLQNAMLLGYAGEIATSHPRLGIINNVKRDDLIEDVEHNRYFVVMMAYDFQMLWKDKRHKLLWETRFSIRERGNDFVKMLPSMSEYASQFFGEDSHGLIRTAIPEGSVEIGVPKTVAGEPEKVAPLSETTLIADADTFSSRAPGRGPDLSALPAPLAGRIAAYEREKATLQSALSARTRAQAAGEETRRAIDLFNSENSTRISALNRDAEAIRSELARLSAESPRPATDQSVDSLVREFNDRVQEIQVGNPLFSHP